MIGTGFDIVTEEDGRNDYCTSFIVLLDSNIFLDSMSSFISKLFNSLDQEVAIFTSFCKSIFTAVSHYSSMISLQTSIHSKASEDATISADLVAQECLVEELKVKLAEVEEACGNMRHSI